MAHLVLSIIVPARDAASSLPRCLDTIQRQAFTEDEIIVVDDASHDHSAAPSARVIRLPVNLGPSHARNIGAAASTGDVLCFVDADVVLHDDALSRIRASLLDHPEWAAVFGSYDDRPEAPHLAGQYRNLLHHFVHQNGRPDASTFWAGCGAIRRDAFESVGGFDAVHFPRYMEDIELGYRLRKAGHRIRLDRDLLGTHLKDMSVMNMVRTDVFHRGRPWVRVNLHHGVWPDDLNMKASGRWSALLAATVPAWLATTLLTRWGLLGLAGSVIALVAVNRPFFSFLRARRGLGFSLIAVPLHILHLLSGGAGGLLGVIDRLGDRFREKRNS